ncbi:MAG: hypothetical protein P4L53_14735 [Candidatus Obscuribacterales bacterium]|nr:hypothetical protein [Candidatus Obscuribacterales bacterium]
MNVIEQTQITKSIAYYQTQLEQTRIDSGKKMQNVVYNKIEVRITTDENEGVYYRPGVGIQILIDETVYIDGDDYYVNVDSFFEALGQQNAEIEFVGGCHHPPCCANGALTATSPEAWIWNTSNFRLRWTNVHQAAALMLKIIDEHTERNHEVWCASVERMPFYRSQLTLLDTRIQESREQ